MNAPISITRRLTRGFGWICLFGGLTLIVSVSFDVDLMLNQEAANLRWRGNWLEIAEHVVLPLFLLIIPMFFAARWVIKTSLAPLGKAAARMDALAGTDRDFRLDLDDIPVEAQPFARALNGLLARLDNAMRQLEAFAADAAHELRTPLAILMAELDRIDSPDTRHLKKDVAAMDRLVGQIMLMSQVDAHIGAPVAREVISLEKVAQDVIDRFAPIATSQNKHIELEVKGRPTIVGIKGTVFAALSNLVENGLRVTPADGSVVISVGPGARIGVQDGGHGLSVAELNTLSQRFVRAEHASADGAGLGLAIVARIAEIHGAALNTAPHRKEIFMTFPKKHEV